MIDRGEKSTAGAKRAKRLSRYSNGCEPSEQTRGWRVRSGVNGLPGVEMCANGAGGSGYGSVCVALEKCDTNGPPDGLFPMCPAPIFVLLFLFGAGVVMRDRERYAKRYAERGRGRCFLSAFVSAPDDRVKGQEQKTR